MKKNITSILAMLCAMLALVMVVFHIITLRNTNAELTSRLSALESEVEQLRSDLESETALLKEAIDVPAYEEDTEAYCTLTVNDWSAADGTLAVDIFAQAVTTGDTTVSEAQLYLIKGDSMQTLDISLLPGEADGSFEAELSGLSFTLPEVGPEEELELELQVTFADCGTVSTHGASWYSENGQLYLVTG